jgi:hypothetical protein
MHPDLGIRVNEQLQKSDDNTPDQYDLNMKMNKKP